MAPFVIDSFSANAEVPAPRAYTLCAKLNNHDEHGVARNERAAKAAAQRGYARPAFTKEAAEV